MSSDQQVQEQLPNAPVERPVSEPGPEASELSQNTADLAEQTDAAIPAIEFRNVDFSYDDKKVLEDLSFKVAKGEIISRGHPGPLFKLSLTL
jgi:ABC-type multidrug transport system fused ATPase/permease subunit